MELLLMHMPRGNNIVQQKWELECNESVTRFRIKCSESKKLEKYQTRHSI